MGEFDRRKDETEFEYYSRMEKQSRFHCFKCHRVWYKENIDGQIVMADGICKECQEVKGGGNVEFAICAILALGVVMFIIALAEVLYYK